MRRRKSFKAQAIPIVVEFAAIHAKRKYMPLLGNQLKSLLISIQSYSITSKTVFDISITLLMLT